MVEIVATGDRRYTRSMPTTPNDWIRWTSFAALLLGALVLFWSYELTQEIHRSGLLHPDPARGMIYAVEDRWYVTPALGLRRNLFLLAGAALFGLAALAAFRRELKFYFWDRYLPEK
ncbi:MAG TPA: hypothetical protein VII56_09455 [Rhizomicrobium sp.]